MSEPQRAPTKAKDPLHPSQRPAAFGWVSLLVLAGVVVGAWFVVQRMFDDSKVQDCVWSGRRNCAKVDQPGR